MKYQAIQDKMQKMLTDITAGGRDIGMQLAVYHKGELIINAWAGISDVSTKTRVTEHTLFPAFSVTKGIAATMLHILADKGKLDYEQRVCEIWPEFAKNGKENILIRHALDHTAGIPNLPMDIAAAQLNDWDGMCGFIEDMKPLWPTGERQEYHAITYGWIVGRIIELASGMPFADFLKQEVCDPLGINHMFIGITPETMTAHSIATLYEHGFDKNNLNTNGIITIPGCCMPMCGWINQPASVQACIPAVNGLFNAHSLARHYAALLPGGVDGVSLLSEDTLKKATAASSVEVRPDGTSTFGLGYAVGGYDGNHSVFGHGGYGGSNALANKDTGMVFAITKNQFHMESAEMEIYNTVQELLR